MSAAPPSSPTKRRRRISAASRKQATRSALSLPPPTDPILIELLDACRRLGLAVRLEAFLQPGRIAGALCRLQSRWVLLLDQNAPSFELSHCVAAALACFEPIPIRLGCGAWQLIQKKRSSRSQGSPRIPIIQLLEPPIQRTRGKPNIVSSRARLHKIF